MSKDKPTHSRSRPPTAPGRNLALAAAVSASLSLVAGAAQAGTLNVPSGLEQRSPLFGASPFKARIVLFEEFGTQPYKVENSTNPDGSISYPKLPRPVVGTSIDCLGNPDVNGDGLDEIIKQNSVYPALNQYSAQNDPTKPGEPQVAQNPWKAQIAECGEGAADGNMPEDGRPWGEDFAHQRWDHKHPKNLNDFEFQPKRFFQTIMANARINGGARDRLQSHGYGAITDMNKSTTAFTEFGPGGLYYNTVTSPYAPGSDSPEWATPKDAPNTVEGQYIKGFEGTTKGIPVNINPLHPLFPNQDRSAVWTFDGTIPPKLLMARYGETLHFRHYNALPITNSLDSNRGFGTHTISTHEHNGHNPAESDGFAGAYFYPGQYYDYRWPMILAGHDSINPDANDSRAATPCEPGETSVGVFPCEGPEDAKFAKVPGDYRETMSTHWFHDHMLDFTAQNVYKGSAAMMNYYSRIDRGNETLDDGVNLRFPSGSAKNWGNRDYDVNLVIGDKAFDRSGQLFFNPLITDGYLGDVMTVNWVYKPFLDVRARKYRLRILNGSVSRYFKIAMAYEDPAKAGTYKQVPMYMVANDGNLMEHAVLFPHAQSGNEGLPTQSIAERDDVIVDFSQVPKDKNGNFVKVYLVNLMEHTTGTGPIKTPVKLSLAWNAFNGNAKTGYNGLDFAIGKFMEFRIRPCQSGTPIYDAGRAAVGGCKDTSMNPADYVEGKKVLLPKPTFTKAELDNAIHRTFVYGRKPDTITDGLPWTVAVDGGAGLNAEIDRISAAPTGVKDANDRRKGGAVEIWHLSNNSGGWSHPAHIHFEEGQIILKNKLAPPPWERFARKDMYRLGPEQDSGSDIDVAIRVRDFTGSYVEHCHNTQHEDHAMLLRWDSEDATHAKWVRTPYPTWYGANYDGEGLSFKLPSADVGSTKYDTKLKTNVSTVTSGFVLPSGWGSKSADVPAGSEPTP
jgi:FtsP/CotA-like multicopper oxidase with cupredoxin domain